MRMNFRQQRPPMLVSAAVAAWITLAPGGALATDAVLPAYKPATNTEHHYRTRKSAEVDMSVWFQEGDLANTAVHGEFRLAATVLADEEEDGFRIRWTLDATIPDDAKDGRHAINDLYDRTLAAFGMDSITLVTDASGRPTAVTGAEEALETARLKLEKAENGAGTAATLLEQAIATPLILVDALVPEALLVAAAQSGTDRNMPEGHTWTVETTTPLNGVDVTAYASWALEAVDPETRTAQLFMTQTSDTDAMSKALEAPINTMIGNFSEKAATLPPEELAMVRTASRERNARFIISLDSGETLEATENIITHSAGIRTVTSTHLYRDDTAPRLTLANETP